MSGGVSVCVSVHEFVYVCVCLCFFVIVVCGICMCIYTRIRVYVRTCVFVCLSRQASSCDQRLLRNMFLFLTVRCSTTCMLSDGSQWAYQGLCERT